MATPMPAARISFKWRLMSKHSRILFDEVANVLLETDDDLLPDVDVEVDLDRLLRSGHLDASGRGENNRRGEEELDPSHRALRRIATQSRQHRPLHRTISLSLG